MAEKIKGQKLIHGKGFILSRYGRLLRTVGLWGVEFTMAAAMKRIVALASSRMVLEAQDVTRKKVFCVQYGK